MKGAIQEQLIAARRRQILDAAAKVFADKGFHAATIKDIARAAEIADGTIYNYFADKTALLLGIFELMRESMQMDADFTALTNTDLRSAVKAFLQQPLMALRGDNFELFRVVVSEILVNQDLRARYYEGILAPTLALAEQFFSAWAARHHIQTTNLSLSIRVMSSTVVGLIFTYILGDQVLMAAWDDLPDILTEMFLKGIGSN